MDEFSLIQYGALKRVTPDEEVREAESPSEAGKKPLIRPMSGKQALQPPQRLLLGPEPESDVTQFGRDPISGLFSEDR